LNSLNTQIFIFEAWKTHKRAKKKCNIESTGQFLVDSDRKCRGRPSADETANLGGRGMKGLEFINYTDIHF
jgi:hypothetical protein